MPIKRTDYPQFAYFWYNRQEFRDTEILKRELEGEAVGAGSMRDIVLDLTACNGMTSSELGILIRVAQRLKNTQRVVRLLTNPRVKEALEATNLVKLENLVVYEGQKGFIEQLKTAGSGTGAKP